MKLTRLPLAGLLLLLGFSTPIWSANVDQVREVEQSTQATAQAIQEKMEQLDSQRREDFQTWRQVRRETLVLEAHNRRLEEWNGNLARQLASLERQLASLDQTREALEPLMEQMVKRLQAFIEHDLPFRKQERLARVTELQDLLKRVDVSLAEKLRQLLATYRSEVDQGRQLSVSREFVELAPDSEPERVSLLRLGRIGLYYLSDNQQRAGVWSAAENQWQPLSARQRAQVARGLELADERGLPELLSLPLSVPLRTDQEDAE
ncbi:Protein of unknown function [Marinospirillum celere]|uniref:DUF3450 domain-containing protein n=1 Tax=Marinospirillum celere TaxID=1122252 RepID=A0A1I1IY18_9GAMM|nr:DUF3450 domain-containing protein [Marinospirillum celere]SFC41209.1 Protein of unknown function [Marinospirillum celere]